MRCKTLLSSLLFAALAIAPLASLEEEEDETYARTYQEVEATYDATDEGISISMIGWGLALAVGIIILAVALGSNDNSNAHQ